MQLTATLKNIGTRDLVDIRMVVEVNTEWNYTVSPEVIRALKRNEETEIQVTLNPPSDISVGEYEAKVNAEVTVENRKVEARDRSITVKVESPDAALGDDAAVCGVNPPRHRHRHCDNSD